MTRWRVAVTCCLLLAVAGCRGKTTKPAGESGSTENGGGEAAGASERTPSVTPMSATDRSDRPKPADHRQTRVNHAEPKPKHSGGEAAQVETLEAPKPVPDSRYALVEAIKEGDVENAKQALAAHPEWAAGVDEGNLTMLHLTAMSGSPDLVSQLLDLGMDVNAKTLSAETPLHLACTTGQTETIKLLLKNKADVNAKVETGETALHIAAGLGYKDAVMALLIWNADPMAVNDDGNTPLHEAAREGSTSVARRLFTRNVDVNARNAEGETPLAIAKKRGNKWMIQLLQQKGGVE